MSKLVDLAKLDMPASYVPRAEVPSTKRVWGDREAEQSGLYEIDGRGNRPQPVKSAAVAPPAIPPLPPGFELVAAGPPPLPPGFEPIGAPEGDSFSDRFEGEGSGHPGNAAELKAGLRTMQSPRQRGKDIAREEGGLMDAIPVAISSGMLGNIPDMPPAVLAGLKSAMAGEGFMKGYDASLEEQRGMREGLAEKFPMTTVAGNVGGAVATGLAAAPLVKAPTIAGRVAKSAAVGGALGGAQGAMSGEGASDRFEKGRDGVLLGAGLGAVGEAAVSAGAKVMSKAFGGASKPAEGVVPQARIAAADEFDVPLTRGQATGNVEQQAYEEAARNSARGPHAGEAVRGVDKRQQQAVAKAKDDIGSTLGPAATPEQAGDAVATALKGRAEGFRAGADAAYARAAAKDAWINADEVGNLGRKVAESLERDGIRLDTYGNYQGAQTAMNLLKRVAGFEGAGPTGGGKIVAQSLEGLEQARKGLLKIRAANAEDGRALGYIRRGFDDWLNDAADRKLFSGDASAIADLKEARGLWSQYRGLTRGKDGDALPIISKIVNEERTGQEVANWLMGTAGAGQAGRSARVAAEVRGMLGANSPEFEALRHAAWVRIANPARGEGPQAVANSILNFTRGDGAPLASTLFSPAEIGKMNRLAGVLKTTVTDPRATNRGQSGYEVARLVEGKMGLTQTAIGVGAAWQQDDPKYLALAALPLLRSASSLSKGMAATRPVPSQIPGELARAGNLAIAGYSGR